MTSHAAVCEACGHLVRRLAGLCHHCSGALWVHADPPSIEAPNPAYDCTATRCRGGHLTNIREQT